VSAASANWSAELEALHEESTRTHFLDVWTRDAIVDRVGALPEGAVVVDLGCSTGYLLADLERAHPGVRLIGIDLIAAGLRKASALVPSAELLEGDARELPLEDDTVDVLVSANMLEHVGDDRHALAEIRRVLKPGARAVLVVPAGPGTYDYYDRFLGHERRYARGELARKGHGAGLEVVEDRYLATLLYPPFWVVKKRNRLVHGELDGEALEQRVTHDIAKTKDSRVGRALRRIEEQTRLRLPFGIRNLVLLRKDA
jgi:SAM-dependent methyltransferase